MQRRPLFQTRVKRGKRVSCVTGEWTLNWHPGVRGTGRERAWHSRSVLRPPRGHWTGQALVPGGSRAQPGTISRRPPSGGFNLVVKEGVSGCRSVPGPAAAEQPSGDWRLYESDSGRALRLGGVYTGAEKEPFGSPFFSKLQTLQESQAQAMDVNQGTVGWIPEGRGIGCQRR